MNKVIIACLIIFSSFAHAQESSENDNPFMREESSRASRVEEAAAEEDIFPGNPGDPQPAPVDQYIPVLILVALGIIVAHAKRNKIAE